jgi:3-oxoacyl-[acyl-carrier protein] reductase
MTTSHLRPEPVVIVTGAGSGIGFATALHLAQLGQRVVLASLETQEQIHSKLELLPANTLYVQTNVCDESSVQALMDQTKAHFGRIDGLVNNAGITKLDDFLEMPVADFDQVITTNLRSVFLCSQRAARVMRDQGDGGVIVNISSNHAGRSVAKHEAYAASKGGIVSMTKAMAWSLGMYGIGVICLSPGLTVVERLEQQLREHPQPEEQLQILRGLHANQRNNSTKDMAQMIAFLLSSAAQSLTGSDIVADNGMSALLFANPQLAGAKAPDKGRS